MTVQRYDPGALLHHRYEKEPPAFDRRRGEEQMPS